jgi:hypothetical protein
MGRKLTRGEHPVDVELMRGLRDMVEKNVELPKIVEKAMLSSPADMASTLEAQRRAFALAMFHTAAAHAQQLTKEYYSLLEKVLAELKKRDPSVMTNKDLIQAGELFSKWILKIQSEVAIPADRPIRAADTPITMQLVNVLVRQAHEAKEQSQEQERQTFSILPDVQDVDSLEVERQGQQLSS